MKIEYIKPEVYDTKTGEKITDEQKWLTYDLDLRLLKIQTNAFSDQGVYNIYIYAQVPSYSFSF